MSAAANRPPDWSNLIELMFQSLESLTEPVVDSLRELLESGRKVIDCAETAILIPNAVGEELKFLVSVNSKPGVAQIVMNMSVPCDGSVVGCVYSTGQMVAVENPEEFYPEVDRKTGLKTKIYLVSPIVSGEEILGVATFVNRPDHKPQTAFDKSDIEHSRHLTDLAAIGLKQYQNAILQRQLLSRELYQTAKRFVSESQLEKFSPMASTEHEIRTPLARVLNNLQAMSRREQEMVAELIGVLASHYREDDFSY